MKDYIDYLENSSNEDLVAITLIKQSEINKQN